MASIETSRPMSAGFLFGARVLSTVSNPFAAISAWNNTRVTRKVLSSLTNRELEDIGLSRGDIANIVG